MGAVLMVLALFGAGWLVYSNENPQTWADAGLGQKVAETWCAGCHQIAPDRPKPETRGVTPPAFAAIADRPEVDDAWLDDFLRQIHLPMPTYRLTDVERRHMIAYFRELRS